MKSDQDKRKKQQVLSDFGWMREITGMRHVFREETNALANASSIWYYSVAFVALVTPLELDFRGAASYNSRPFLLYGRGFGRQQIA
jgi:hypothetical protein